jgi:EAL domain-containing protein (putative c-di-GMP-specific phosphodiesterase class I)
MDCDFAQGHYLSPPLTAEQLVEFAAAKLAITAAA